MEVLIKMINIAICDDNISIYSQIEKNNCLKFNIEVFLMGKNLWNI